MYKSDQDPTTLPYALAGTICDVGLKLPVDFDTAYLKKGSVISDTQYPIKAIKTFKCRVVLYESPWPKYGKGEPVTVHAFSSKCPGKFHYLLSIIDKTNAEVIRKSPKWLK